MLGLVEKLISAPLTATAVIDSFKSITHSPFNLCSSSTLGVGISSTYVV